MDMKAIDFSGRIHPPGGPRYGVNGTLATAQGW